MRKYRKTFRQCLDKNRAWAYQEIIVEALVILWFSCHISVKLGTRIYPEWKATRLDPSRLTTSDNVLLSVLNGQNGCFWDSMVASWKPTPPVIATGNENVAVTNNTGRAVVGYVATFAAVCTTAIVGVSVGLSLFVNRRWNFPQFKQHLPYCQRITAFFRYDKNRQYYWADYKDPNASRIIFVLLHLVLAVVNTLCFVWVWCIVCALPVVTAASILVAVVIRFAGEDAVFPCSVLFICLLGVHCTGRIWGVWMTECYSTWLRKKFGAIGWRDGPKLAAHPVVPSGSPHPMALEKDMPIKERRARRGHWLQYSMFVFLFACAIVDGNVRRPLFMMFPQIDYLVSTVSDTLTSSGSSGTEGAPTNWTYWTWVNRTVEHCRPSPQTGFAQNLAMMSYWTDLAYEELRGSTSSKSILLMGFASSLSPLVDWISMVWTGLLVVLSDAPLTLLLMLEALIIGVVIAVILVLVAVILVLTVLNFLYTVVAAVIKSIFHQRRSRMESATHIHYYDAMENGQMGPENRDGSKDDVGVGTCYCKHSNQGFIEKTRVEPSEQDKYVDCSLGEVDPEEHQACSAKRQPALPASDKMSDCAQKDAQIIREPFCVCSLWANLQCAVITLLRQNIAGVILPFPVVAFFLPERLQLPGLLMLLMAYLLWNYGEMIRILLQLLKEKRIDDAAEKQEEEQKRKEMAKPEIAEDCANCVEDGGAKIIPISCLPLSTTFSDTNITLSDPVTRIIINPLE
ncbi:uncharacterized protein LOC129602231 [Paramacrobiotus metropolitanus]|uniref:uncharacterized protein LOC129602231 n=1 Tax=Paramacrobiotus metropolitanus TaxID=2943436 RepID=UPI00244655AA|nr:uncharacterized protein LOC129602231 [Paramacrobiotus metropolitanus]